MPNRTESGSRHSFRHARFAGLSSTSCPRCSRRVRRFTTADGARRPRCWFARSGGFLEVLDSAERVGDPVPTGEVLVHHPSLALRASFGSQASELSHAKDVHRSAQREGGLAESAPFPPLHVVITAPSRPPAADFRPIRRCERPAVVLHTASRVIPKCIVYVLKRRWRTPRTPVARAVPARGRPSGSCHRMGRSSTDRRQERPPPKVQRSLRAGAGSV